MQPSRLILFAAVGWALAAQAQGPAKPILDAPSATIGTRPLRELAIYPERSAPAQSLPANESKLSAEVSARILALPYDVGQRVRKDDVVARLDKRDFELAVAKARASMAAVQARIAQAESQLERARALEKQNFISAEAVIQRETELAVQRAELAVQRANLATAQRELEKTIVRAPFDAIVKQRHVGVGELASPGAVLVTLIDESRPEVSAQVQLKDTQSLKDADGAVFIADGDYPVRLTRVSPAVDRESRTVEARLAFQGRAAAPGTSGRLVWRETRPHLPAEYVVRRGGELGVFVMSGNATEFVALPAAQEGRPVPVVFPVDTQIVTEGRNTLGVAPAKK
ncbi:MAG: efflux RND transporter periplasmic adaptor subunit [Betaproteobacteria bacterium]|jgi:RND family efflux transporter MFP subunit|nr:efflux RND transporter periplasmic adaptor subunit [Betaproteobacteria bacterium]